MKLTNREITLAGLMAAIMVVVTVITRIPFINAVIPFSMQTLVAVLAGVLLGSTTGFLSMLAYILLGLVGLPVFATEPFGGPAYVLKPTFGFILGMILAAYVAGLIFEKSDKKLISYLTASVAGMLVIYLVGLPYIFVILNFFLGKTISVYGVIKTGFLPFILWDLIKAVVVALIAKAVHQRLPNSSTGYQKKIGSDKP